ncbi:MAG: formylmethanofuran--tetrahydromethanopterin N-formyltransferase [Planctomycetes bacterium]|nr:formylmethanofuran--tetrahydromethanopterin N-formyltransferase [Planctomycetota bacterium]
MNSSTTDNQLTLNGTPVADTFAEAFPLVGTRLLLTAVNEHWAKTAASVFCGFATSVIACDAEVAVERELTADETPDGRPGVSVLIFAFGKKGLEKATVNRVGQCVLTCPTTACFDGLPPVKTEDSAKKEDRISVGGQLRYFGDGFQISKKLAGRRYWRIPVMDGEFLCADSVGFVPAIGGGNLLICGQTQSAALDAATSAVEAMSTLHDIALPFPGGIVRSGSKVGSRYPKLKASTNDAYCPTLAAQTESALPAGTSAVYEIVIDGFSFEAIQSAMRAGLHRICACPGITLVSAGNYGGKLGPHHFHLRDLLE